MAFELDLEACVGVVEAKIKERHFKRREDCMIQDKDISEGVVQNQGTSSLGTRLFRDARTGTKDEAQPRLPWP